MPNIDIQFSFNEDDILQVSAECSGIDARTIQLNINETNDPDEIFLSSGPSAVVLCIDVSGSMSGHPIEQAKKAATAYINKKSGSGAMIGCTAFGSSAATVFPLLKDISSMLAGIDKIKMGYETCGGGTNMEKGLRQSIPMLDEKIKGFNKQIIILSDGYTSGNVRSLIPTCMECSITVHTVGAGGGYDRALLEEIATKTGGMFVAADNIDNLVEAFLSLAEK
ncbi:MAG: hypothetical protein OMM_05685 [Candidatus Magnetoglobus multicellularis str. Araruama]|uniref:VWFA domain-containing protein n=1 Tax=Candidatus Magnetoglobus multicellularis str. Araruama TaxID=890399 RepID=A0A1V1NUV1_9BACT|nr:MAG: hypothetical protein OMM_05685 [Candidatus Magnetoglobus multicellularis str. Araruama]